jgi:rRNA maturation RNase YbeY
MIIFFNEDIKFDLTRKRIVKKWLRNLASERGLRVGQLNYIFCSDPFLRRINRDFLGHDYFTDIITFDYSTDYELQFGPDSVSGDIYISIDTVSRNAEIYGEGFERELHRVIAHGLLHLVGFDDVTKEQQVEIRVREEMALESLFTLLSDS